jgi:hypothetical protein
MLRLPAAASARSFSSQSVTLAACSGGSQAAELGAVQRNASRRSQLISVLNDFTDANSSITTPLTSGTHCGELDRVFATATHQLNPASAIASRTCGRQCKQILSPLLLLFLANRGTLPCTGSTKFALKNFTHNDLPRSQGSRTIRGFATPMKQFRSKIGKRAAGIRSRPHVFRRGHPDPGVQGLITVEDAAGAGADFCTFTGNGRTSRPCKCGE